MVLERLRRREVLGGITATVAGVAGCSDAPSMDAASAGRPQRSAVPPHDHSSQEQGGDSLAPQDVSIDAFHQPASYVVYQRGDEVRALDGVTQRERFSDPDARTVIQSAIDELAPGGTVFLTAGTYEIGPESIMPRSGTRLVGEGIGATILRVRDGLNQDADGFYVIHVADGVEGASIANLEIDGNESNNRDIPPYPDSPHSHGIRIAAIESPTPAGQKPTGISIENVYVHDTIRSNVAVTGRHCELDSLWLANSATDHWLYLSGAEGCTIDGVHASGFARTEGIVIGVGERPAFDNTLSNVVIEDLAETPFQSEPGGLDGRYPVRAVIVRPSGGNAHDNTLRSIRINVPDAEVGQYLATYGADTLIEDLRYRGPPPRGGAPFIGVEPEAQGTTIRDASILYTGAGSATSGAVSEVHAPDVTLKDLRITAPSADAVTGIRLVEGPRPVARATIRDLTVDVTGPALAVNRGEYGIPSLFVENLQDVNDNGIQGVNQIDPLRMGVY